MEEAVAYIAEVLPLVFCCLSRFRFGFPPASVPAKVVCGFNCFNFSFFRWTGFGLRNEIAHGSQRRGQARRWAQKTQ